MALVDAGPDLRLQLIDAGVAHLDGVLISHEHADHTHGIDDLRPIAMAMRGRVDLHMNEATSRALRREIFVYFRNAAGKLLSADRARKASDGGRGQRRRRARAARSRRRPSISITATSPSLGFRVGDLAYTPDLNGIPLASRRFLEGLEVWIVDALRYAPHPSHFSLEEALAWIETMRPRRAILTNLHTDLDYETLRKSLPAGVVPAYDGMRIEGF